MDKIPTPRTDAMATCKWLNLGHTRTTKEMVDASFARQLERELTAAERRVSELEHLACASVGGVTGAETTALPADVLLMCRRRGWSLHWTHRGAYLHLEASELIEAIRGKHGDPTKEAADVLLVLMSITEYAGIPWEAVMQQAREKCDEMMTRPHYQGEEYSAVDSVVGTPAQESKPNENAVSVQPNEGVKGG